MNQRTPLFWDRKLRQARPLTSARTVAAVVVTLAQDVWGFGSWSARLALAAAAFFLFVGAAVVVAGLALAAIAVGQR